MACNIKLFNDLIPPLRRTADEAVSNGLKICSFSIENSLKIEN